MENIAKNLAALNFYIDAGVDEVIGTASVDRFAASLTRREPPAPTRDRGRPAKAPTSRASPGGPTTAAPTEAEASARALAAGAADLAALRQAMAGFELCPLKKTAANTVFGAGNPKA